MSAHAAITALFIGALSGGISGLAGLAVNRAKKWSAPPLVRLALAGSVAIVTAGLLVWIAAPSAAVGPGTGAILWAEKDNALPLTLLAVCLLLPVLTPRKRELIIVSTPAATPAVTLTPLPAAPKRAIPRSELAFALVDLCEPCRGVGL